MQRKFSAIIEFATQTPADVVYSVAVSDKADRRLERLEITRDGAPVEPVESIDRAECRLHRIDALPGTIRLEYRAEVEGRAVANAPEELDRILYRRPSRYAESDALGPSSRALFPSLAGWDLVDAVVDWVHEHVSYVRGSSLPTDGARETFLKRQGVCRDFAHLVIALLRAHDVPARLVSVYAPQLAPMDFHAVAEVMVDDEWFVVDATRLAPRRLMQRIATGRDAADTAFLSYTLSSLKLAKLAVTAEADEEVAEDPTERVQLG